MVKRRGPLKSHRSPWMVAKVDWVAVEELSLSYYMPDTILFTIYPC